MNKFLKIRNQVLVRLKKLPVTTIKSNRLLRLFLIVKTPPMILAETIIIFKKIIFLKNKA